MPFGATAAEVNVFGTNAAVFVKPLSSKVVNGNSLNVAGA
jgi:hypothetical protein